MKTLPSCDCAALVLNPLLCVSVHTTCSAKIDLEITGAQIDISLLEGLDKEHLSVSREVNMNGDYNIPAARYEWQRPYLAAALETDSQLLSGKISEARQAIHSKLSQAARLDASEQSAAADALNALATLEQERLHPDVDTEHRTTLFLDWADAKNEPSAA